MSEDKIFSKPLAQIPPFEFTAKVADVFDDMLQRSVPCYREIVRRQAQLTHHFFQPGTLIYDLGCSHGNFALACCAAFGDEPFGLVAIDSSEPMLERFRQRLPQLSTTANLDLRCQDIRNVDLVDASVVVINLTLQFLPVADREALLRRVWQSIRPGGLLLLTEKIVQDDTELEELQRNFYYRFKEENGYSQLEISQKREALENVLVPESLSLHLERLRRVGFRQCDVWLKWFNFVSMLCVKDRP